MKFATINELVGDTKNRIDQLNVILDVLLSNYREASNIIDTTVDRRQTHLEQLLELNQTLGNIVDTHPAIHVHKLWQSAACTMSDIIEQL
jgi:hypothetical protein